jgi:hypothetical protein
LEFGYLSCCPVFFFAGFRHGSRYGHNFNGYSLRAKGLERERKSEKLFLVSDYIDKKQAFCSEPTRPIIHWMPVISQLWMNLN